MHFCTCICGSPSSCAPKAWPPCALRSPPWPLAQITSLFQHLSPALVAYLLRWQPDKAVRGWASLSPEVQASMNRAGFVELTLWPMGVWAAWATAYYIFVRARRAWGAGEVLGCCLVLRNLMPAWVADVADHARGGLTAALELLVLAVP